VEKRARAKALARFPLSRPFGGSRTVHRRDDGPETSGCRSIVRSRRRSRLKFADWLAHKAGSVDDVGVHRSSAVVATVVALPLLALSGVGCSSPSHDATHASSGSKASSTASVAAAPPSAAVAAPDPVATAITLTPKNSDYVYVDTKSGLTRCMIATDQVICKAKGAQWPVNGAVIKANGSIDFQEGDFGLVTPDRLDYQTYRALGWTIVASSSGTRFTNDGTGHGADVSVEQVRPI
jgi:hypothetical protein